MCGLSLRSGFKVHKKRGAALVEFVLISTLLFTLVLGIIDFGLMIKSYLALSQVAREGARLASLGATDTSVQESIYDWAGKLGLKTTNGYLIFTPGEDDVPAGKVVEIQLEYKYDMVTGSFFAPILGGNDYVRLKTSMVTRK